MKPLAADISKLGAEAHRLSGASNVGAKARLKGTMTMKKEMRFGRRLMLPSTRQIIHEMRVLEAEEAQLKACKVAACLVVRERSGEQ